MLTLITGTPGAGKTLYATWEIARKVPGSFLTASDRVVSHGVEYQKGDQVPRHLFSNIKNLLVEHTPIDADNLNDWHTWAQPGDVILFDEVQECWRPRTLGKDVPPCIAKLETHRHMGVDIILVTQSPMLTDSNVRRLVNQHFHLRRLATSIAYVYEWDHCSVNPGTVSTALQSKIWMHPKKCYELYKSSSLHTKPTARLPRLAIVGVLALVGALVGGYQVKERFTERFAGAPKKEAPPGTPPSAPPIQPVAPAPAVAGLPAGGPAMPTQTAQAAPAIVGCIHMGDRCSCFGEDGGKVPMELQACREASYRVSSVSLTRETTLARQPAYRDVTPVPPSTEVTAPGGVAAASPMPAASPSTGAASASRPSGRVL